MDIIYSYLTTLVEKLSSVWWWISSSSTANQNQTETSKSSDKDDVPVTNPLQTSVSEGSSPAQTTVNSRDHPHIVPQFSNSFSGPDETAKVDKINIILKSAGKTMEVDKYPLESISLLLKEACDWAGKKPEKMCLVYQGDHLDVNKTVSQYGLRGGSTVHLIHA